MSDWNTRVTLIDRARCGTDHDAWKEFVYYYDSFITAVLKNLRCPDNALDDIKQMVLVKLWKSLNTFHVDPERARFRSWMSHIIRNTLTDYHRHCTRRAKHEITLAPLSKDEMKWFEPSTPSNIDAMIEEEWEVQVTQRALKMVSKRFSGKTIAVFELALQGLSPDEIARKCELKKNSVYRLSKRVQSALREEIRSLQHHLEGHAPD